jgi:hypothetical protein
VHRFAAGVLADLGVDISQMIPYCKTLIQSMKKNLPLAVPLAGHYLTGGVIYIILSQYPHFSSTSSEWVAVCSKGTINNV